MSKTCKNIKKQYTELKEKLKQQLSNFSTYSNQASDLTIITNEGKREAEKQQLVNKLNSINSSCEKITEQIKVVKKEAVKNKCSEFLKEIDKNKSFKFDYKNILNPKEKEEPLKNNSLKNKSHQTPTISNNFR
ncbi:hypothetical protein HOK00_08680 [bacterium]|jgi:hypothetical protein|nr:hypothetical protein [bacterium]